MNVQLIDTLFTMLQTTNESIARLGEINIADHIKPAWFLQMPNAESLAALGDAAERFRDSDGDLLLQIATAFSPDELGAGVRAGGQLVPGYKFPYPRRVVVGMSGWCGYHSIGVGYARHLEVAVAVCAFSLAAQAKEEEEAASLAAQTKEEEED